MTSRRRLSYLGLLTALFAGLAAAAHAEVPDLRGTWKISTPQSSFKPIDGAIVLTPLGKQILAENRAYQRKQQYDEYDHMKGRCSAPGMPRMMLTPDRFVVFQRSNLIVMAFEWNRLNRMIPLPGLPDQAARLGGPGADLVGTMAGTSSGQWENDTLVVATDKFSDKSLIDELIPHGYDLKVTERIRLTDRDTLEDRLTIEDPEYFVRPWTTVVTYKRQPEAILPEDVCLDRLLGPPTLPTR
jgi:hypothetical protein